MAAVTVPDAGPTDQLDVAWEELGAQLQAFVARRVSDPEAVEDLVQDVLVRLHVAASSRTDIRDVTAWLHRVARNAVIDYYRSRRRLETPGEISELADPSSWPYRDNSDDRAAARELAQCLRPFVDRLPPIHRDALLLTDLQGQTQTAAAAALGLSVSGMKSRVQRARRELRALLVDCCPVEVDHRGAVIDFVRPNERCDCEAPFRMKTAAPSTMKMPGRAAIP